MLLHGKKSGRDDLRPQRLPDKTPFLAVVVRVNDGDTICVERVTPHVICPGIEYIRLAGIDAPEVRSIYVDLARWSQQALAGKILGKEIQILPSRQWRDPFSRIIARVRLGEIDINEWMVVNGHAKRLASSRRKRSAYQSDITSQ